MRRLRCKRSGARGTLLDGDGRRLLRAPTSSLSQEIAATLAEVGRRLVADRVTLWTLRPGERDDRRLSLDRQWSRPGCAIDELTFGRTELPWLVGELAAGRAVTFRTCAALPREAARERRTFARHGPRSAAILPVVVGGATIAALSAGTLRRERSWGRATLAVLERVADAVGLALVRQRAHDASLEAEGRLGGLLETGPEGILLVQPSGRIELANGRATTLFLRTRAELCAARLQDLLTPVPGEPLLPRGGPIDALLAIEGPLQLSARRSDGSTLSVEVTLRELRAPGEELFCCAIRDVSDEQLVREETARLRNELAFMGRTAMLAEMGAGIAHELNQPLTAILSNAETAQRLVAGLHEPAGGDLREALGDVVADTRRAAEVLARMRDMLRRREVARIPIDVAALLAGVSRRFREEAVARSIRLTLELGPGLPPLLGDPVQLEQVAMNLVLNAFEAVGADGEAAGAPRTIVLRARATQPEGVDVSVRDSGPGLDGEALARAFEAFFTTKPHGLGMGLAISRSIVEAHGGRLLARNNADRGATFQFHLPAAPRGAAAARTREPA
jgi:two-component system, LuxR family, sensor kinase FixL